MPPTLRSRKKVSYIEPTEQAISNSRKRDSWSSKKLYDLEIINQRVQNGQLEFFVHYKGWDRRYDEWRKEGDVVSRPLEVTEPDANAQLIRNLQIQIKENLRAPRKTDTKVTITIPCQLLTFETSYLRSLGKLSPERGLSVFRVTKNCDLSPALGQDWYFLIVNNSGDVNYVIPESVHFHLYERQPLIYYRRDLKPVSFHRGYMLSFSFVFNRGTFRDICDL